jgi:transcriptional adapter 2-alpha
MYRRLGLTTAADIDKYELDLAKRVWHPHFNYYQLRTQFLSVAQTQAKLVPARDYHSSERLQGRSVGRHSSGPDPRRSSFPAFGEAESRKSHDRESTPRLPNTMAAPGAAPVIRRPRERFFAVLARKTYLTSILEQLHH